VKKRNPWLDFIRLVWYNGCILQPEAQPIGLVHPVILVLATLFIQASLTGDIHTRIPRRNPSGRTKYRHNDFLVSSIGEGVDWTACLYTIKSKVETNEKNHPWLGNGS
jgi:hypothetical protein